MWWAAADENSGKFDSSHGSRGQWRRERASAVLGVIITWNRIELMIPRACRHGQFSLFLLRGDKNRESWLIEELFFVVSRQAHRELYYDDHAPVNRQTIEKRKRQRRKKEGTKECWEMVKRRKPRGKGQRCIKRHTAFPGPVALQQTCLASIDRLFRLSQHLN